MYEMDVVEVVFPSDDEEDYSSDELSISVCFEDLDIEIPLPFGGYDYEFVDEISPYQKCPVCLLPMRDAVQTEHCGHRFCKTCLEKTLSSENPLCPTDRCVIPSENGFFSDKACAREIVCLRVKCKESNMGCRWIGQVLHAEQHRDECPYVSENCVACGKHMQRRLQQTHMSEDCPQRIVKCTFCEDEFPFAGKEEHEEEYCRRFPLPCSFKCGQEEIPREMMASHISNDCPMKEVICPYAEAGCPFQDKRARLNDHLEVSLEDHLQLTWSTLEQARVDLVTMKQEVVTAKLKFDSMEDLRQQYHTVMSLVNKSREECKKLSQNMRKLENENASLKKSLKDMEEKILPGKGERMKLRNCYTDSGFVEFYKRPEPLRVPTITRKT